jgi:hypothetical protein
MIITYSGEVGQDKQKRINVALILCAIVDILEYAGRRLIFSLIASQIRNSLTVEYPQSTSIGEETDKTVRLCGKTESA